MEFTKDDLNNLSDKIDRYFTKKQIDDMLVNYYCINIRDYEGSRFTKDEAINELAYQVLNNNDAAMAEKIISNI